MKFIIEVADQPDLDASTLFDQLDPVTRGLVEVVPLDALASAARDVALESLTAASKSVQEGRPDEARSYVNTAYSALRLTRGAP